MMYGPILVTERLILRPPNADDLDGWAKMSADDRTMTHIGGTKSRSEAWRDLCTMAGAWTVRGFAMFSMILRENGEWIGRTGPWQPEDWPGREVGWGIRSEYEGKGLALEAAKASLDYVFDVLRWDEVMHCIAPDNNASAALAERLGSANKGPTQMPHPFHEHPVNHWGQTREEWLARRKEMAK